MGVVSVTIYEGCFIIKTSAITMNAEVFLTLCKAKSLSVEGGSRLNREPVRLE
ncbi:hypothetical protein ACFLUF_01770 [Chloroflexota bacterium]